MIIKYKSLKVPGVFILFKIPQNILNDKEAMKELCMSKLKELHNIEEQIVSFSNKTITF
jgi:hypothetical protein